MGEINVGIPRRKMAFDPFGYNTIISISLGKWRVHGNT